MGWLKPGQYAGNNFLNQVSLIDRKSQKLIVEIGVLSSTGVDGNHDEAARK